MKYDATKNALMNANEKRSLLSLALEHQSDQVITLLFHDFDQQKRPLGGARLWPDFVYSDELSQLIDTAVAKKNSRLIDMVAIIAERSLPQNWRLSERDPSESLLFIGLTKSLAFMSYNDVCWLQQACQQSSNMKNTWKKSFPMQVEFHYDGKARRGKAKTTMSIATFFDVLVASGGPALIDMTKHSEARSMLLKRLDRLFFPLVCTQGPPASVKKLLNALPELHVWKDDYDNTIAHYWLLKHQEGGVNDVCQWDKNLLFATNKEGTTPLDFVPLEQRTVVEKRLLKKTLNENNTLRRAKHRQGPRRM